MGGPVVEKGSSGQGWEGLGIIHVGDRHSSSLGGGGRHGEA